MRKLGFLGGGNMAEALLHGLIVHKVFKPGELAASDIDPIRRRKLARRGIKTTADNVEVVRESNAILIAVKPQHIDEVLRDIANAFEGRSRDLKKRLIISIAAGVTIDRIAGALGKGVRVIRVMPNAPAIVGRGMAALVKSKAASKADEAFALRVFQSVGDAVTLKDESMLDAVTGLSGSGPAYVYLFVKALADAATNEGIPSELALRMALKTIEGAEQVMRSGDKTPDELIRIVASPGGTTEAALRQFATAGFSDIVAGAVHAATRRSRELGKQF